MSKLQFILIVAVDEKNGIAKKGKIPWHNKTDLAHFKNITTGHVVIMGRKTWDSLSDKYRPLPNRINVVITRNKHFDSAVDKKPDMEFNSVYDCINHFSKNRETFNSQKLFIIGGASIYKQFIKSQYIDEVVISNIYGDFKCDQHIDFDMIDYKLTNSIIHKDVTINKYNRIIENREEKSFLELMSNITEKGTMRIDRTGTGTLSVFSRELRFDLSGGHIPMCTTRPLSFKIIFEELMWILRGQTDNKILQEKNIHIWDKNTTREFLDKRGLVHYEEGNIGPSYGFQMRYFGAAYTPSKEKIMLNIKTSNQTCNQHEMTQHDGFDQLKYVVNLLKTNPESRRIIINLWNPVQLDEMALPPCVYGYQFYVANKKLSCKMIQRSSDIALAGAHNCAAGALFVRLLCAITHLEPGELIWSPADIHIYLNQVGSVKQQLTRTPTAYPILDIKNIPNSGAITDFKFKDLRLVNYNPQPRIKFEMNA